MADHGFEVEHRAVAAGPESADELFGRRNHRRDVGHDCAVIERWRGDPAMPPPGLSLGAERAGAEPGLKQPPDVTEARVIIDVVEEDPLDPLGVADEEDALPQIAARDEELVEQFLVESRQRIGRDGLQERDCAKWPRRAGRRYRDRREIDFVEGQGTVHATDNSPLAPAGSLPRPVEADKRKAAARLCPDLLSSYSAAA